MLTSAARSHALRNSLRRITTPALPLAMPPTKRNSSSLPPGSSPAAPSLNILLVYLALGFTG